MRRVNFYDDLVRDIRYAARTLARNPTFTFAALLALALGIGANTAVFSVVNAVLLQPLPYADPGRLVMIFNSFSHQGTSRSGASLADFLDWKARSHSFQMLDAFEFNRFSNGRFTLTGDADPEEVIGLSVTSTFFETLGVHPLLGRTFARRRPTPSHTHGSVERATLAAPLSFKPQCTRRGSGPQWPSSYDYWGRAGQL